MGKLVFYYGTMGAGKSAKLIKDKWFYEEEVDNILVLKSEKATRDGKYIKSRNGEVIECEPLEPFIKDHFDKLKEANIILIDEVQFCSEDTINTLSDIVDNLDIDIYCYGLKTDLRTHLFSGAKRLLEIADMIVELPNMCRCGERALFSIKISGDDINGKYKACCRKCAKKLLKY